MSRLIRKSWTDLPRPVAGPLHRADDGTLWGLVAFGWPEELTSPDASWWRDLATAATATANNLEAELSGPVTGADPPLMPLMRALYCVHTAQQLPEGTPFAAQRLARYQEEVEVLLGRLTEEQHADVCASWRRDEAVYAEHEESAADARQPVGEPLGLRDAALGRPPYVESPPVGTHPQAEERTQ